MSLVVTATDTEVGKTVVSALLLHRYAGANALYWKPIATGFDSDWDTGTVRNLGPEGALCLEEAYLFRPPVSPHLAARWAEQEIDPNRILARHSELRARHRGRPWIIEGIGGLLVPLRDDSTLLVDLLVALGLPCVLVASSQLGTINHTLLSLEAMRARGLEVAGVVLNGPRNEDNREAIERFGEVSIIAEVEPMEPLERATLAEQCVRFDPSGILERYLFPTLQWAPGSGLTS
ncbi:MAG: dethiobiotin synthase [Deltaproteobacteria bacterium]|nr:dethiobiotin synthase [Deltaproteobacteria bacterium]